GRDKPCPYSYLRSPFVLYRDILKIIPERSAKVRVLQSELYCSFQETQFVSGVIALAVEVIPIERLLFQQVFHCIGDLNLSARTAACRFQQSKDFRHQDIPTYYRQI